MYQSNPNREGNVQNSSKLFNSAFKELFHSAGVVLGGILISALLVSRDGRH